MRNATEKQKEFSKEMGEGRDHILNFVETLSSGSIGSTKNYSLFKKLPFLELDEETRKDKLKWSKFFPVSEETYPVVYITKDFFVLSGEEILLDKGEKGEEVNFVVEDIKFENSKDSLKKIYLHATTIGGMKLEEDFDTVQELIDFIVDERAFEIIGYYYFD